MVAAAGILERLERLQHTCRQIPVGSSAALALQSPQAPKGQSAWLRGQEMSSLAGKLFCTQCTGITSNAQLCHFPLHHFGPG